MSKFFRSLNPDSDSSSSEASNESEDGTDDISRIEHPTENGANGLGLSGLSVDGPATTNGWQSQVLLHALLEERCLHEVLREQTNRRRDQRLDDAAVRAEASVRYQRLCATLAPHNLISSGLEHDALSATRQRYRDGLDLISRSSVDTAAQASSIPAPLRRLLTHNDNAQVSPNATQTLELARLPRDTSSLLDTLTPAHAILGPSRYIRDFNQLGVLGQGGYGTVYRVKHKLDSVQYAVKIVPISAGRMARIGSRGQQEVDDLLLELRTLARLEHPNIVRYFAGWIEWSNAGRVVEDSLSSPQNGTTRCVWSQDGEEEEDAVLGAEDSQASLGRVITRSDDDGAGILFEDSCSHQAASASASDPPDEDVEASIVSPSIIDSNLHSSGDANLTSTPGPALALHLQMALYPLTLADYLMPQEDPLNMRHCFHLQPSVSILLALLDGVGYLHSEDIVHRDLKPANTFMAENNNPRSTRGSVDLLLCRDCRAAGKATTTSLNIRIGDFGLVTALAQPETTTTASGVPVGTEIYRPFAATSDVSASLDIFALGIIAFELLWPFSTSKSPTHPRGQPRSTLQ